jgi:6,7-dimethyl-8-ribityllumazine synthase
MTLSEGSKGDPTDVATHRLPGIEEIQGEGVSGSHAGIGLRIGIVCARFNGKVTGLLLAGALAELERLGVAEQDSGVVWVPGAFELPVVAMTLAKSAHYDAVVCLGAVIRGETSHYEFVAGECASGIARVQLDTGVPVAFGVLTTENLAQALDRAGGSVGNKGTEAVTTAIEMVNLLREIRGTGRGAEQAPER